MFSVFDQSVNIQFARVKWVMVKPDFHSRFSLVASEFFRTGHAQSGEQDGKISFAPFAFEVQIFRLPQNFLTAKPIRLLS